jgi:predicted ATP-grasp superfamily ATP-dependent carboligase
MTNILVYEFLSGGGTIEGDPAASAALLAQGTAMRDAVAADLAAAGAAHCRLTVAGAFDDAVPRSAALACAQRGEAPLEFIARQARQHDAVWVIAPECDGLLAAFERAVAPQARWLGCDAGAIALASSKAATVERLHAGGVATPRADAFARSPRWVTKPDDGAGAVDARVHAGASAHEAALRDAAGREHRAWVEPWIDGQALSLSLLARRDGVELLAVSRQRIEVAHDGRLAYRGVEIDVLPRSDGRRTVLEALAERVARALPGLRGFVGVDLVWHEAHGPVAIEVNPRVTCSYVGLSARLQRNVGVEALACFT